MPSHSCDTRFSGKLGTGDRHGWANRRQGLRPAPALLAVTLLLFALALPEAGLAEKLPKLLKARWIEVETANFSIKSTLNEKKTRQLGLDLELFRLVVHALTGVPLDPSPIPTEIFALKRSSDLRAFGAERGVAGFFVPGLRRNLIVLAADDEYAQEIIQHEYVHFLTRNAGSHRYPGWYDEGFAELLASTHVKKDKVVIGALPRIRINSFAQTIWIPMNRVLTQKRYEKWTDEDRSMFYAQSWLLVHFLQFGREDRNLSEDMANYQRAIEQGKAPLVAFEEVFGFSGRKLDLKLQRYVNRREAYTTPKQAFPLSEEAKATRMKPQKLGTALASAMMQLGQKDFSQQAIAHALDHAPESARAWAMKGDWLKFDARFEEALPYFEKALALAPDDPEVTMDMAEFWLNRAQSEDASDAQRLEWLQESRRYFVRAWKIDDTLPEIYAMYGRSYQVGGDDPKKAVEMLTEASRLLPSYLWLRLQLARAYRAAGQREEALELATSVEAWAHPGSSMGQESAELISALQATSTTGGVGEPADADSSREASPVARPIPLASGDR